MYTIKHQLHIDAEIPDVYNAISTISGLSKWWTEQTTGSAELGSCIDFRFGERFFIQMKVIESVENKKIVWQCTEAEPDWIGTILTFDFDRNEGKTLLRFEHDKWPTHGDFFAHCNFSWAKYLTSLRALIETGTGSPFQKN